MASESKTLTTDQLIGKVGNTIRQSTWRTFGLKYLGLSLLQVDQCDSTQKDIIACIAQTFNIWVVKNGKDATMKLLKKHLEEAVGDNVIPNGVLDVFSDYPENRMMEQVSFKFLMEVAQKLPDPKWQSFAVDYLCIKKVTVENTCGSVPADEYKKCIIKMLETWKNTQHPRYVSDLRKCIEDAIRDEILYPETLETFNKVLSESCNHDNRPQAMGQTDSLAHPLKALQAQPDSSKECEKMDVSHDNVLMDAEFDVKVEPSNCQLSLERFICTKSETGELHFEGKFTKTISDALKKLWGKKTNSGVSVGVAVLDTGVNTQHPFLKDSVADSYCAFTEENSSTEKAREEQADLILDSNGHGTSVAGIILQHAPMVKLYNIKVLGKDGTGTKESLMAGLQWVLAHPEVNIVNFSGSASVHWDDCSDLISELAKTRTMIVAASNNGRKGADSVGFPAQHGMVTAVGSHDSHFNKSPHSSVGPRVDFLCPGESVACLSSKDFKIVQYLTGTSFAAPYASAVAAQILVYAASNFAKECYVCLCKSDRMRKLLLRMCSYYPVRKDDDYGYGHLEVEKLFEDNFAELHQEICKIYRGDL